MFLPERDHLWSTPSLFFPDIFAHNADNNIAIVWNENFLKGNTVSSRNRHRIKKCRRQPPGKKIYYSNGNATFPTIKSIKKDAVLVATLRQRTIKIMWNIKLLICKSECSAGIWSYFKRLVGSTAVSVSLVA